MTLFDVLFAPSWWMIAIATIIGATVFWQGNKRLDKQLKLGGLAVLGLVVVWFAVARAVETGREAADSGTRKFVAAVVERNSGTLGDLMAPSATLGAFDRDDIVYVAKGYADEWGLKRALITSLDTEERGSQLNTTIRVFSEHEGGRGPGTISTDWIFTWAKAGDQWKIVQISPVRVGNTDISGVVEQYFRNRPRR